jgi:hypothetical protein
MFRTFNAAIFDALKFIIAFLLYLKTKIELEK